MNKLGHMRALALLATLGVTGCSRDCASRSATAEVGKGTPALETRSDPPRPVTGDDVVVVVSTEFGLFANGSHETDHGSGYCALVLGGKVRGGWILGRWPGLAKDQLFEGRDLAVTTDFRDVFVEVTRQHLAVEGGAAMFPGYRPRAALNLWG